ncbi:head maturation protease, ClpP-related [Nocardioides sp. 503]|uniref:head maturation protease, ClpP-related n=1 Tax=Nocardioides sp. 503 TaxID=2508326 RepID=UPI00106F83A7|nr:head maturation protease, ClpP-related [Nocardioides sp. 503]
MRRDPVYRFRGYQKPTTESRTPILSATNELPATTVDGTTAVMRLYDPVDDWGEFWGVSASEFAAALDALPSAVNEIHLHINSPGGVIFEGIAILNQLRQHPARVVAIVDGVAASIASVIAVGADETVMNPDTLLMVHDGSGFCMGTADDMREVAAVLDTLSDTIAGVYARKAGGTVEDWRTTMKGTVWYTAQQALDAGLVDRIAEAPELVESEPAAAARAQTHRAAINALTASAQVPSPTVADPHEADPAPTALADQSSEPGADAEARRRADEDWHRHLATLRG